HRWGPRRSHLRRRRPRADPERPASVPARRRSAASRRAGRWHGPWTPAGRTVPVASRSGWTPTARPEPPPDRSRSARPTGRRAPRRPTGLRPGPGRGSRVPLTGRTAGAVGWEALAAAEGDVAGGGLLGGQDVDVDEAAGAGLVEGVALVVGGEVEVVQPGLGA